MIHKNDFIISDPGDEQSAPVYGVYGCFEDYQEEE